MSASGPSGLLVYLDHRLVRVCERVLSHALKQRKSRFGVREMFILTLLEAYKKRLHETFLLSTQSICLIGKELMMLIFGGYIILCVSPYNSYY